jgi:hypothetical protein
LNLVSVEVGHFAAADDAWKDAADDLLEMTDNCTEFDAKSRKTAAPKEWRVVLNDILSRLPAYQRPV